jgi:hypothetical protein
VLVVWRADETKDILNNSVLRKTFPFKNLLTICFEPINLFSMSYRVLIVCEFKLLMLKDVNVDSKTLDVDVVSVMFVADNSLFSMLVKRTAFLVSSSGLIPIPILNKIIDENF